MTVVESAWWLQIPWRLFATRGPDSILRWYLTSTWSYDRPISTMKFPRSWWRHQMETFSALLALCAGNSPVTGEFPSQRPVTRSFYVFFDLHPNKRLSKQSWGWWFDTPSHPLWRHRNGYLLPGPQFIIKMISYQYMILRPSYLHNGISYIDIHTGKTIYIY